MIDRIKVINFLQDFGCARLEQLQMLFNDKNNNFKSILNDNNITKKGDIFVHNKKKIDEDMIKALDILCKYKVRNRLSKYYLGYNPVKITFLTNENLLYHIIVANEENKKVIIKKINSYPISIPVADKLILVFPDKTEKENIKCKTTFIFCTYIDL